MLTLEDGRVLRSTDLVGATLMIDAGTKQVAVTIESIEEDPTAVGGRVLLHHFVIRNEDGTRSEFCTPDGAGESLGFPVPDDKGGFELTCTSGAIGKCVRWGYRFWEEKPGGPPLHALHQACIHMTRADYGGDGSTFTRDGTIIYMCDRFGVRPCAENAPMQFEAASGRGRSGLRRAPAHRGDHNARSPRGKISGAGIASRRQRLQRGKRDPRSRGPVVQPLGGVTSFHC